MVPNILPDASRLRELFDYNPDTGVIIWRPRSPESFATESSYKNWNKRFSGKPIPVSNKPYRAQTLVDGKAYPIHRIIFKIMTGVDPVGVIDHINQDHTDNRWCNLRDVNVTVNRLNTKARADNRLGIKGVSVKGKKYVVHIGLRGRSIHIGSYDSYEIAAIAHQAAAKVIMKAALDDLSLRTETRTPYQPIR